jgi:F0F1-type ATP synthase epsilon subunit
VSILTDQAINVEEMDDSLIEEAIQRAQEALEEGKKSNIDAAEIERLEATARFAMAQKIARGKRR